MVKAKVFGTDLSIAIYGGIFNIDNAGSSAGVELLNFIYGVPEKDMLSPDIDPRLKKYGHNLARKLAYGGHILDRETADSMLQGDNAEAVLGNLFSSLQIQPPNVKRTTDSGWTRKSFFPFSQNLIHWDIKKSNENVERSWMRGAGTLLHKILRKDEDQARLKKIRDGFSSLYEPVQGSALDRLSDFFRNESNFKQSERPDVVEAQSRANIDEFEDVYRNGILNILAHCRLTTVGKIEALVNWSALWLAIMQYKRSSTALGYSRTAPIVCDCSTSTTSIRRLARKQFKHAFNTIKQALDSSVGPEFSNINDKQKQKVSGFFPSTASAVGILNAYTGSRYFTLKIMALETIVAALVPDNDEIPFLEFVDNILYQKLGIVVSRGSAKSSGLLDDYDGTIFEENEIGLAIQMKAAGLLTTYSDATQMISFKR
jgi:hypothetical protein